MKCDAARRPATNRAAPLDSLFTGCPELRFTIFHERGSRAEIPVRIWRIKIARERRQTTGNHELPLALRPASEAFLRTFALRQPYSSGRCEQEILFAPAARTCASATFHETKPVAGAVKRMRTPEECAYPKLGAAPAARPPHFALTIVPRIAKLHPTERILA